MHRASVEDGFERRAQSARRPIRYQSDAGFAPINTANHAARPVQLDIRFELGKQANMNGDSRGQRAEAIEPRSQET
jgi:hypothetical protein